LALNQAITLGAGDLTLDVRGDAAVTQTATGRTAESRVGQVGSGTVNLDQDAKNVATLAGSYNGSISYRDANGLVVGTVTDTSMGTTTTSGITSNNSDVKLTVLLGGLALNQAITLGAGDLTLDVRANSGVTQTATGLITASGLQLLGSGTVNLDQDGNDVATLAATYNGPIAYTDANALMVGTVGTSVGIKTGNPSNGGDVTITSGGVLT